MEEKDLHSIKRNILKNLGYRNSRIFSELQEGEDSSKISFHLKKLLEDDLIEKEGNKYETTSRGKEYLAYLESKKGDQSVVLNHLLIFSNGKVYLDKRSDALDPFKGIYRGIVEREKRKDSMKETARKKFHERFEGDIKSLEIVGALENRLESERGFSQNYISFFTEIRAKVQDDENFYPIEKVEELSSLPGYHRIVKEVKDRDGARFIGEWTVEESKDGEFSLKKLSL